MPTIPPQATTDAASLSEAATSRNVRILTLVHAPATMKVPQRLVLGSEPIVFGREPGAGNTFLLDDGRASRKHTQLTFLPDVGSYRVEDLQSRNGTKVNGRTIESEVLTPNAVIRIGTCLFVYSDVSVQHGTPLPNLASLGTTSLVRAIAESAADLVARSEMPVVILGPTGAGKELMARRIHETSKRSGPLVAVNCATFNRELLGSELFGHVAGAFSGARGSRSGLFAAANGGTLFLDEIAELPLEQQPALLRVLQERRVRPVGSDSEEAVDVRVVAATHRSLPALVRSGSFREDLYARLAGFVVTLPGLADRREEIIPLFKSFLGDPKRALTTSAAEALLLHDWSMNVRELRHVADRARVLAQGERIEPAQLALGEPASAAAPVAPPRETESSSDLDAPSSAGDDEPPSREALVKLLESHGGNVAEVARATGKHRPQVYRWLRRFGIDLNQFR